MQHLTPDEQRPYIVVYKIMTSFLIAYQMKNNCWLFERLFKIQENGAFLFEISFFFKDINIFVI